jgi:hypothetical protein
MSTQDTKKESHPATADLWRIAETGDAHDLESILATGVEIDASDSHGMTALMRAAHHGRIEMVRLLLHHGADPNLARNDKFTPLMLAAFFGHEEIVRILVQHGADMDAGSRFGTTAQQWAAARTFQDVVHYLKTTGAGPKSSNKAVVEHSESQAPKEANTATVNSNFTMPVVAPVHSVEELGGSTHAGAVETPNELPNEQKSFENIPANVVVGSQLQPLYRRRIVYAFAILLLAVGLFAALKLRNNQPLNVVSTQVSPPIVVDPTVMTTNAASRPEAKPIPPSDAKVETLASRNDVNNSYKKPEKANNPTAAPAARGVVSTRNSGGSSMSEKLNGTTSISQPLPSPVEPKDVRNAELPAAAAAIVNPKPAAPRDPTPQRRTEPPTTQLLSRTRSGDKGRVIQWP